MAQANQRGYRRSWKNLLINKRYQLRFTLFMVLLSAFLMFFLGFWVMREAEQATTVSVTDVQGHKCPEVPEVVPLAGGVLLNENSGANMLPPEAKALGEPAAEAQPASAGEGASAGTGGASGEASAAGAAGSAGAAGGAEQAAGAGAAAGADPGTAQAGDSKAEGEAAGSDDPSGAAAGNPSGAAAGNQDSAQGAAAAPAAPAEGTAAPAEGAAGAAGEPSEEGAPTERRVVDVSLGTMELKPPGELPPEMAQALPPEFVELVIQSYQCRLNQAASIARLHNGYRQIMIVLVAVGTLLIFGLTLYGIKMTHKVAGPLYKVSLYLDKMRDGKYDEVYNLRKGDQLVEFYEHFKEAHAGLRAMEEEDVARLRAILEVAERTDLGSRSPEIAAAIAEMKATLKRKEDSLE